jgi:protein tyrosine phosphatase (PTP) superfamily phosphohydrolase (DUF442 family)
MPHRVSLLPKNRHVTALIYPGLHRLLHGYVIAAVSVLVACGAPGPESEEPSDGAAQSPSLTAAAPASLGEIQALGLDNAANPAPGLITAAQVSRDQFDALVDMGYQRFISLRVPSEDGAGWEEEHIAGSDVSFARIPVSGATGLTRENVETLDRLLDESSDDGTVLYCASSNRVGALLALRAYWLDGVEADQAHELGRRAGMTSLEARVAELMAQPR